MQLTPQMWDMLIRRIDNIERKLGDVNRIRLWKAKVAGAFIMLYIIVLPLLLDYIRTRVNFP